MQPDRHHPARSGSLWAIARDNLDWILTPAEQRELGGPNAIGRAATLRLAEFNGKDPALMDGRVTSNPRDPDALPDGWQVNVNVLGLRRPPPGANG